MPETDEVYRDKAEESLAGAVSEYANGRYNNCANRCYYCCFQAAVYALQEFGVISTGSRSTWSHEALQAAFARELIQRRKVYPAELRDVLARTAKLRQAADYTRDLISEAQALRALRRAQRFVGAVRIQGERSR